MQNSQQSDNFSGDILSKVFDVIYHDRSDEDLKNIVEILFKNNYTIPFGIHTTLDILKRKTKEWIQHFLAESDDKSFFGFISTSLLLVAIISQKSCEIDKGKEFYNECTQMLHPLMSENETAQAISYAMNCYWHEIFEQNMPGESFLGK